jgi:hypothetical protein
MITPQARTMTKIEKDVPIPSLRSTRKAKYPFGAMEPGDSFFWETDGSREGDGRVRVAGVKYGQRHGMEFVFRRESGGLRVWRTK